MELQRWRRQLTKCTDTPTLYADYQRRGTAVPTDQLRLRETSVDHICEGTIIGIYNVKYEVQDRETAEVVRRSSVSSIFILDKAISLRSG
uniref:Uncharacterized protein n=1 Tax=Hyaloperonospora arabidopsidis (strain Emoy2) TaxID=559515 RepID=M4B7Z6_HYAAE